MSSATISFNMIFSRLKLIMGLLFVCLLAICQPLWALSCALLMADSTVFSMEAKSQGESKLNNVRKDIEAALMILPPSAIDEINKANLTINVAMNSVTEIEGFEHLAGASTYDSADRPFSTIEHLEHSPGIIAFNSKTKKYEMVILLSEIYSSETRTSVFLHELFHLYSLAWGLNRQVNGKPIRYLHDQPEFKELFDAYTNLGFHELDRRYFGRHLPEFFAEFHSRFFTSPLWRRFLKDNYLRVHKKFVELYGENTPTLVRPENSEYPIDSSIGSLQEAAQKRFGYIYGRDLVRLKSDLDLPNVILQSPDQMYKFTVKRNMYGQIELTSEQLGHILIPKYLMGNGSLSAISSDQ